jgi:hypothetical protein
MQKKVWSIHLQYKTPRAYSHDFYKQI